MNLEEVDKYISNLQFWKQKTVKALQDKNINYAIQCYKMYRYYGGKTSYNKFWKQSRFYKNVLK